MGLVLSSPWVCVWCQASGLETYNSILIDELHCIVDEVVDGAGNAGGVDAPGHIVEAGLAVLCPVISAAVDVLQILAFFSLKRSVLASLAPGAPGWAIR